MKMENFEKTTYIIGKLRKKYVEKAYQTIFLNTFQYHKHELEIARFGARAQHAGTVDVKRLIYIVKILPGTSYRYYFGTHFSSFSHISSPYFSTPFSLRLLRIGGVQEHQRLTSSFSSARSSSAYLFVALRDVGPGCFG